MEFGPTPAPIDMPADAIEVFTDGSCDPNPGPGGWGFVAYRGEEEIHEASGGDAASTNNRMELQALIQALRWLDPARPAIVWSDSQYVVRGCIEWRHGWRKKNWTRGPKSALANAELWQILDGLLDSRIVDVRWTRGHVGTLGNERADELADRGRLSILEVAA
ncbi:ribonuclease H family protein [Aureimonas mangrovi]|uniref:ribonuclease H family protein n=1 Tax=Aureimonas mangrovi TaxID=2758041 RepID=UPI001FEAA076|nr:ribonuclease H [Aureimonas mangrovi]